MPNDEKYVDHNEGTVEVSDLVCTELVSERDVPPSEIIPGYTMMFVRESHWLNAMFAKTSKVEPYGSIAVTVPSFAVNGIVGGRCVVKARIDLDVLDNLACGDQRPLSEFFMDKNNSIDAQFIDVANRATFSMCLKPVVFQHVGPVSVENILQHVSVRLVGYMQAIPALTSEEFAAHEHEYYVGLSEQPAVMLVGGGR